MAEKTVMFLCVFLWSLAEFAIVYYLERKVFGVVKKRITKRFFVAATIYVAIIVAYIIREGSALSAPGFLLTVLFYIKSYIILNEVTIIEQKTETLLDIILVQTFVGIGGQTIFYYVLSSKVIKAFEIKKEYCHGFFALLIMFFLMAYWSGNKTKTTVCYRVLSRLLYICIILMFLALGIMEVVLYEGDITSKVNSTILKLMWLSLFIILTIITANLFSLNKDKILAGTIMEMLKEQNASLVNYYEEIGKKEKKLHAFKHDMDNMMLGLRATIEKNDKSGTLEYVNQMGKRTDSVTEKYETGNYVANAILNIKAKQLEEDGNSLEFCGNMPQNGISNMDISILLSNALDNSIEACKLMPEGSAVSVESETKNNLWKLVIVNPCNEKLKIVDNHINTTKKNKLLHGYGLKNIEEVVRNHYGTMRIYAEDGLFRINILLELRTE